MIAHIQQSLSSNSRSFPLSEDCPEVFQTLPSFEADFVKFFNSKTTNSTNKMLLCRRVSQSAILLHGTQCCGGLDAKQRTDIASLINCMVAKTAQYSIGNRIIDR